MDVEQAICTKEVRIKSNKSKSLAQSKKNSPAAMRKEIELQIIGQGDVLIEKICSINFTPLPWGRGSIFEKN